MSDKTKALTKEQMIDSAIAKTVTGGTNCNSCEEWVESCGNKSFDWCGDWQDMCFYDLSYP